jgi:VWFA-related protein
MPLRAMLVFDTSSSLALGGRLQALKAAGDAFIAGLRPADEVGLLTFSQEIAHRIPPTADKAKVRSALAAVQADGGTAVIDALYAGLVLGEGGGRALVVLFSDGEDNMSVLGEQQLKRVAERSNALVHVVAWREAVAAVPTSGYQRLIVPNAAEPDHIRALRTIAEASGGRLWGADSPEKLRHAFAAIAEAMGHRYVLRYEPERVKREGWHAPRGEAAREEGRRAGAQGLLGRPLSRGRYSGDCATSTARRLPPRRPHQRRSDRATAGAAPSAATPRSSRPAARAPARRHSRTRRRGS